MNLQTKIPLQPEPFNRIDYDSKVLLLGSCFSENIGDKFNYFKFQKLQNPFGILFHPLAIETLITHAINDKEYTQNDVFFHNEQWHCFDAHSRLSHPSKAQLIRGLNASIKQTNQFLNDASHFIITLGTSWVYRFIETDTVVANCHKIPQKQFVKELLSVEEIVGTLEAIISLLKSINPDISILFTVSPVRHLKDGYIENTQSKSHLIAAIHQVVDPKQHFYYFPSYEIMMDELRDYRFYAEDMLHPNLTAIQYIWERFVEVWISNSAQDVMKRVDEIQKGFLHRPFNPTSDNHLAFIQQLEVKQKAIQSQFPHISFL